MYRACMPCFDDYWSTSNNAHRLLAPGPTGMRMDRSAAPPVPTAKPAKASTSSTATRAPPAVAKAATAPKKRALLVGVNYFGTEAELNGCINDVRTMRAFLQQQGFETEAMRCLTDDAYQPQLQPTKANILQGMKWLVSGAAPGDVFFFHFSGHGGQQVDVHGDEEDGMDETICPVDFVREGQISDDELFAMLAAPLPSGCRLTALLDCCHSGHGMDFPFTLHDDGFSGAAWNRDTHFQRAAQADVVLFSGCEDDQCSADASCRYGKPAGAMTTAFVEVMQHVAMQRPTTYVALLRELKRVLEMRGFDQLPQISSTLPFHLDRAVALGDATAADAPAGPVVALPRPPCTRREFGGGFGAMLGSSDATGFFAGSLFGHALAPHHPGGGAEARPTSFAADSGARAAEDAESDDEDEDDEDDEDEYDDDDDDDFDYDDDDGY